MDNYNSGVYSVMQYLQGWRCYVYSTSVRNGKSLIGLLDHGLAVDNRGVVLIIKITKFHAVKKL